MSQKKLHPDPPLDPKPPPERHDRSRRKLFAHREMAEDLLRLIDEPWVAELDLSSLGQVADVFVDDELGRRAADTVWRVRWRNRPGFLYLPLEFQSRREKIMVLRVGNYETTLYLRLIANGVIRPGRKGEKLPRMVTLVLYNGKGGWPGSPELGDLLQEAPELGQVRRWDFRVIDERRFELGDLGHETNLVAVFFHLERSERAVDIVRGVDRLAELLPSGHPLRRSFTIWLRQVLVPSRAPGVDLPGLDDLEEIRTMLAENVLQWTQQWKQEGFEKGLERGRARGRKEGRKEGRKKGHREGEAWLLTEQLEQKFGPLSEGIRERIAKARPQQLLEWGRRVLTAATLEEVFRSLP